MAYAADHGHFIPYFAPKAFAGDDAVARKPGIWRRIFDAIMDSRRKHADRDIARLLASSGGRMTDDIERQMMRLVVGDWNVRP